MQALKDFLADYWLWILIPALILGCGLAAILLLSKDDEWSPTDYDTVRSAAAYLRALLA